MARGCKTMTEEHFKKVKKLLDAGVDRRFVSDITQISYTTVCLMARAKTFEDYRLLRNEKNEYQQNQRDMKKSFNELQNKEEQTKMDYDNLQMYYYVKALLDDNKKFINIVQEINDKLDAVLNILIAKGESQ